MKKNKNTLIIAAVIIITALLTILSIKGFNSHDKIAYVDLQKVYKDFKMKDEIEKEAKGLLQTRQLMLDSLLGELQSRESEIGNSKDKELKLSFEKDKESYFQKKQYFENSSQQIIEQYNGKIWETIQALSVDFAKAEGIDIILGKGAAQSFVYGNEKLDYTLAFIDYINIHYGEKKK